MTTTWRFNCVGSECLETAIWARRASVGQPPSSKCAGALAFTTPVRALGQAGRPSRDPSRANDLRLDGGNLRLSLGDGGPQIFQRQFQLRRVQLLGLRAEFRASVVLNLALQLLDQHLQLGDEGVVLGNRRLYLLTRCVLDQDLGPSGVFGRLLVSKGLYHLGRQIGELAQV